MIAKVFFLVVSIAGLLGQGDATFGLVNDLVAGASATVGVKVGSNVLDLTKQLLQSLQLKTAILAEKSLLANELIAVLDAELAISAKGIELIKAALADPKVEGRAELEAQLKMFTDGVDFLNKAKLQLKEEIKFNVMWNTGNAESIKLLSLSLSKSVTVG